MTMKNRTAGFSLMELLIVVTIAGILAAIAYPSYMSHVRKSRRAEATIALESLAQAQERFYAQFRTYTAVVVAPDPCAGAACGLGQADNSTENDYYALSADGNATTYSVTATATGPQLDDTICRTLTINNAGTKSATNASGGDSSDTCW